MAKGNLELDMKFELIPHTSKKITIETPKGLPSFAYLSVNSTVYSPDATYSTAVLSMEDALALREALSDLLEEMGVEAPRHMPAPFGEEWTMAEVKDVVNIINTDMEGCSDWPDDDLEAKPIRHYVPCLYCNGRGNHVYAQAGGGYGNDICINCAGAGSVEA